MDLNSTISRVVERSGAKPDIGASISNTAV